MVIASLIVVLICVGLFVFATVNNKRLEKRAAAADAEAERLRQYYESETIRFQNETQSALANAQALLDQQLEEVKQESERVRQHYQSEAHISQVAAEALVAKTLKELEPLRKYESLREPEAEVQRLLADALAEANGLRQDAQALLEKARTAAADDRAKALQKAKELRQQAEAVLTQATRDAGRIVSDAEKRAEQIGGDAYAALRDKQTLEQAVQALWNVTEGYGDRYVIPTRSMLDELAADFGHTEAGEALRAARDHSRRMVEQKQAGACNYEEPDRRDRANRFVVDAFNGRVDAILSRTKHDNYGTLAQEIRDAFSMVNLNGLAFRDAHILPAYLDARLVELKWATVVQELRLKEREEQQSIREQMREEEKVRRETERVIRESALQEEMLRKAMENAQEQIRQASTEQKAKYEQQLQDLAAKLKEAEERSQRAISMAQQTRRGNVYIISNVGSFGEDVYKIGLTRRLNPQDRVDELGDSSVPFEFDVHAMIPSEDAPALESQLHKHFVLMQVNKVNHRKEFFRVDLQHIREELQKLGVATKWTMTAEAAEYRQTQAIEKKIKENPALRDAWVKRQLQMELLEHDLAEAGDTTGMRTQEAPAALLT
jgi:Meiotically up-regulated gene 113/Domain of unknown function (DUF4041)